MRQKDRDGSNPFDGLLLQEGEPARRYASSLACWHPIRQLFTEYFQWIGKDDRVFTFLWLLSEMCGEHLREAHHRQRLRPWFQLDQEAVDNAPNEFIRFFPGNVLVEGTRIRFHARYFAARAAIERMRDGKDALKRFDGAVATILDAVRSLPPPTPTERAKRAAFRLHLACSR